MNEAKHSPLPWSVLVGKEYCFHDTTRVAIVRTITLDDGIESTVETVAEVWPGDNDIDIKDAEFIVHAVSCHDELVQALDNLLNYVDSVADEFEICREIAGSGTANAARAALAKAKGCAS